MATEYTIPDGDFDSNRAPQSWMVACPDNAVADHLCNYWRQDKIIKTAWREPVL
jgi:hypothetical protein